MSRMLLTVEQIASPIRTDRRKKRTSTLRGLGLGRIGLTAELPDTPVTRGMINKVKHLVRIIYWRVDIRLFADEVRAEYREMITGANSRIVSGAPLWDKFEAAAARCIADPKLDERQLTEVVNEIAVASVLVKDKALQGKRIEYEPALLADGRRIDFVVDRGADNLYVEVKTVHPKVVDDERAWQNFLRRKEHHPKNVDFSVTREGMGGAIHGNEFASRAHFLEYTVAFEERLAAAKEVKPGPGVIVFCGSGFPWRKSDLEDFADFYRTGVHRADDPFGPMEKHDIKEKGIKLLRNVDHFAYLQRPFEQAQIGEFHFPVRGPRFGAGPV